MAGCSQAAALAAVRRWHYSRALPPPKLVRFGIWEDGDFRGAVVFGRGATSTLVQRFGLDQTEGCELVRVALGEHRAPVSQIVARALKLLARGNPGLRLVVSFADPYHSHHGGIYQAGNWVYLGQSSPTKMYQDSRGRLYHERVVSVTGMVKHFGVYKPAPRPTDLRLLRVPGKHRYAYPLDRAMRRQLLPLALPFPVAVEGSMASCPGSSG